MRILSFLPAALCAALALASYMPHGGIRARAPVPSSVPCTDVTAADCPQTSLCGDELGGTSIFSILIGCDYPPGTTEYACSYVAGSGARVTFTAGFEQCCPLSICTSASKRALPEPRHLELALSQREQDMERDIEDENQPW
ncbi:hypothetical protein CALCODRAFT_497798 [Calocera cornea HHB12733]|uniref:Uncharacterized protein n=1 Tax=Calocera cornea HHB12733 TaxID=1353952 RepID=A0A165F391_9BASI|nr:hypothetical protein CALCODRAFT_497798 [Calocera cornea HHB12733]